MTMDSRVPIPGFARQALVFDLDDLLGAEAGGAPSGRIVRRRELLAAHASEGWLLFAHAWRPGRHDGGSAPMGDFQSEVAHAQEQLGVPLSVVRCTHPAGPPVCWCRKPLPGLLLEFALREQVSLDRSMIVGTSAADRTMANRLGVPFRITSDFFGEG